MQNPLKLLLALLCLPAIGFAQHEHQGHSMMGTPPAHRPDSLASMSIYQLGSTWRNDSDQTVTIDTLIGRPIVLAMILRVSGLSVLAAGDAASALIVSAMLSRLMMVYIMRYMPPARKDGLAHDTGKPEMPQLLTGTVLTFVVCLFLLGPSTTVACFIVAFVACVAIGGLAMHQINGFSGDVLGASQQITEIAVLLFLVGSWGAAA